MNTKKVLIDFSGPKDQRYLDINKVPKISRGELFGIFQEGDQEGMGVYAYVVSAVTKRVICIDPCKLIIQQDGCDHTFWSMEHSEVITFASRDRSYIGLDANGKEVVLPWNDLDVTYSESKDGLKRLLYNAGEGYQE